MDKRIKYGLGLIEAIVLLCVGVLMGGSLLPIYQQVQNFEQQKYEMVYQYDNDVDINGSYYLVDSVLTNKTNKKFKAEMLMQKPVDYTEVSNLGLDTALEKHQIAITENLLKELELKIEDEIEFYNPVYDLYVNYTIVKSLDSMYGFFEKSVNSELGAVIIGYDATIPEMTKLDSVVFATRDFKPSETGMALDWSFNKNDIQKELAIVAVFKAAILYLAMSFVILIMWFAYFIFGSTRLVNMIKSGSSKSIQNKYIVENYLWPNSVSVIGAGAIWSLYIYFSGSHMYVIPVVLISLLFFPIVLGMILMKMILRRRV